MQTGHLRSVFLNRAARFAAVVVLASVATIAAGIAGVACLRESRSRGPVSACPGGSIIAFGDSITYGAGLTRSETYPARLAQLIGRPVCNAGINGDTVPDGLARLDRDVVAINPSVVIILFGTNDSGMFGHFTALDAYRTDLAEIVNRVRASGSLSVLASLPPVDGAKVRALGFRPEALGPYDAEIRALATRENVPLVDLAQAFAGDTTLLGDGVHPNAAGAQRIAEAARPVVDAALIR